MLFKKARKENIQVVFIEAIFSARKYYKTLRFTTFKKDNLTESSEDVYSLAINVNDYKQSGGGVNEIIYVTPKNKKQTI